MNITFITSGNGPANVLKHFIKIQSDLDLSISVLSHEQDCTGISLAKEFSLQHKIITYTNSSDLAQTLAESVNQLNANLVILLYGKIIGPEYFQLTSVSTINIHPSLLPAFKGLKVIDTAINYGVKVVGTTIHFVTESLDDGPIIIQSVIPVSNDIKNFFDIEKTITNNYILTATQAVIWFMENRLKLDKNRVYVKQAKFEPSEIYPNIEEKAHKLCTY